MLSRVLACGEMHACSLFCLRGMDGAGIACVLQPEADQLVSCPMHGCHRGHRQLLPAAWHRVHACVLQQ